MTQSTRLRTLSDPYHLPALRPEYAHLRPALGLGAGEPPPRILLLYGSLRERSYSRLVVEESARLLIHFGCEVKIFDPSDLPCPIRWAAMTTPPSMNCANSRSGPRAGVVQPERHGQITGIMKTQIDHLPLP
jgi:arsenic resistance protein ArsH